MTGQNNKTKKLLATSFAGLLAVVGMATTPSSAHAADDACYGVNKCKGTGACGGKGHSCAGKNGCQGKGWLHINQETCLKIEGGRLTPEIES